MTARCSSSRRPADAKASTRTTLSDRIARSRQLNHVRFLPTSLFPPPETVPWPRPQIRLASRRHRRRVIRIACWRRRPTRILDAHTTIAATVGRFLEQPRGPTCLALPSPYFARADARDRRSRPASRGGRISALRRPTALELFSHQSAKSRPLGKRSSATPRRRPNGPVFSIGPFSTTCSRQGPGLGPGSRPQCDFLSGGYLETRKYCVAVGVGRPA